MEKQTLKIFHFTIPSPAGNFGDDVLSMSTKDSFCNTFSEYKIKWINYPLRNHTTDNVINKANSCDLILLGGGGLLLKDTASNNYSGWQWNCSLKHLKMIEKPLIVYSIGYNRFRGQEDFDEIFYEHINKTVEKSVFFSVRNNGSKKQLLKYGLTNKDIIINPCSSLFYESDLNEKHTNENRIGINLAGDRNNLRYDKTIFYQEMLKVFKELDNYSLSFLNYNWNPSSNCQGLIDNVPNHKFIHNLDTIWNRADTNKAYNIHNNMDIILAMRGHGQMIPFGMKKKVISLITHNKLKWFLEDADMEYTGIEVSDNNFSDKLIKLINYIKEDKSYFSKQDKALKKFYSIHLRNSKKIRELII